MMIVLSCDVTMMKNGVDYLKLALQVTFLHEKYKLTIEILGGGEIVDDPDEETKEGRDVENKKEK